MTNKTANKTANKTRKLADTPKLPDAAPVAPTVELTADEQAIIAKLREQGDSLANLALIADAKRNRANGVIHNPKHFSDVVSPVRTCHALAAAKLAETPDIRRKDMIDYLMSQGIAFYTARTQYQVFLQPHKADLAVAAPAAAAAAADKAANKAARKAK